MSLRFNSCGNVDCLCLNHTKAPEYSMSDQRRANAVPLSKLAQSNSKSEDTPNCDCLCHNPDALKWGCEHCAMPPQYTTIQDVVNGTPKGQEAVQKAIDDSIEVQNEMSKEAQDTSLDDILAILDDHHSIVTDELGKSCAKELLAWHKAEIAKINHLIVLAKLEGFDIAFDCHDYDRLRAYKEQLTKELGDSEAEKNSGTWSRE